MKKQVKQVHVPLIIRKSWDFLANRWDYTVYNLSAYFTKEEAQQAANSDFLGVQFDWQVVNEKGWHPMNQDSYQLFKDLQTEWFCVITTLLIDP